MIEPLLCTGTVLSTLLTMQRINLTTCQVASVVIPILSVSKLRHREVKLHTHCQAGSIDRVRVPTKVFRDPRSAEKKETGARLGCRGCLTSLVIIIFICIYVKM